MHEENSNYPVEIGGQGQCTINCKLFQVVQFMHAVREGPIGIVQCKLKIFLINKGLISKVPMQGNRGLEAWNFG